MKSGTTGFQSLLVLVKGASLGLIFGAWLASKVAFPMLIIIGCLLLAAASCVQDANRGKANGDTKADGDKAGSTGARP